MTRKRFIKLLRSYGYSEKQIKWEVDWVIRFKWNYESQHESILLEMEAMELYG